MVAWQEGRKRKEGTTWPISSCSFVGYSSPMTSSVLQSASRRLSTNMRPAPASQGHVTLHVKVKLEFPYCKTCRMIAFKKEGSKKIKIINSFLKVSCVSNSRPKAAFLAFKQVVFFQQFHKKTDLPHTPDTSKAPRNNYAIQLHLRATTKHEMSQTDDYLSCLLSSSKLPRLVPIQNGLCRFRSPSCIFRLSRSPTMQKNR